MGQWLAGWHSLSMVYGSNPIDYIIFFSDYSSLKKIFHHDSSSSCQENWNPIYNWFFSPFVHFDLALLFESYLLLSSSPSQPTYVCLFSKLMDQKNSSISSSVSSGEANSAQCFTKCSSSSSVEKSSPPISNLLTEIWRNISAFHLICLTFLFPLKSTPVFISLLKGGISKIEEEIQLFSFVWWKRSYSHTQKHERMLLIMIK